MRRADGAAALFGWIISLSDRFTLAGLTSPEQTGIHAAAYGLASAPFLILSQFLSLTLRPVDFDAVIQHDRRRERRTLFAWMAALALALSFGLGLVIAFAGPITRAVVGSMLASCTASIVLSGALPRMFTREARDAV
jgi:O-antigen/teichoic acid export membrane protein